MTRRLNAADQCNPAGHQRVATRDWELVLAGGQFHLHALKPHSSLKTRCATRCGSARRRVASGSLSLARSYRPMRLIIVSDQAFQSICVHGRYPPQWYGNTVGCKIPGRVQPALRARLEAAQRTPQLRAVCGQGANPRVR